MQRFWLGVGGGVLLAGLGLSPLALISVFGPMGMKAEARAIHSDFACIGHRKSWVTGPSPAMTQGLEPVPSSLFQRLWGRSQRLTHAAAAIG